MSQHRNKRCGAEAAAGGTAGNRMTGAARASGKGRLWGTGAWECFVVY